MELSGEQAKNRQVTPQESKEGPEVVVEAFQDASESEVARKVSLSAEPTSQLTTTSAVDAELKGMTNNNVETVRRGSNRSNEGRGSSSGSEVSRRTENEETLFCSPFREGMDPVQYRLRMFAILGLFPFIWIGWVAGLIYGAVKRGTKPIHKKLMRLLAILAFLGLVIIGIVVGVVVGQRRRNALDGVVTQKNCPPLQIDSMRYASSNSEKPILFMLYDADSSWSTNPLFKETSQKGHDTYVARVKSDEGSNKVEGNDRFGLRNINAIVDCLKVPTKNLTLVAMVRKEEAELFSSGYEEGTFKNVFVISAEEPGSENPKAKAGVQSTASTAPGSASSNTAYDLDDGATVASVIGLGSASVECGGRKYGTPMVVVIDGAARHVPRTYASEAISKFLYPQNVETKKLDLSTKASTTKMLTSVGAALKAMWELEEESAKGDSLVLCSKVIQ
ncbi:coenzyme F420-0:L-glutamate ligase [Babesia caballi]|uniref:Coenzyme F420-0:L-glutamate ligase n=1 Tax=Babesia caballi TaxID=5871 RepID=A0AAV4LYG3_BABCB|nr:coenzyme F420-0:L-glutamate ligase [Babesia caballi]